MRSSLDRPDPVRFELNTLLEIAHLALDERMPEEAQQMFALLTHLFPSNPHPRIGQALVMHSRDQTGDAIALLEAILRDFPQAVFTRSLLARLMHETNLPGWQTHAQAVLRRVSEGVAYELAEQLLRRSAESNLPALETKEVVSCPTP